MAGDTTIPVVGNLTADPELRFTPSGAAVANFTVASTARQFDRTSNEWKDGETLFMRCSVWRDAAENVAESLQRGTRVLVSGRLKSRSYETKEGEKRTVIELDVDELPGPDPWNSYYTARFAWVDEAANLYRGVNQAMLATDATQLGSALRAIVAASTFGSNRATTVTGAADVGRAVEQVSFNSPGIPSAAAQGVIRLNTTSADGLVNVQ